MNITFDDDIWDQIVDDIDIGLILSAIATNDAHFGVLQNGTGALRNLAENNDHKIAIFDAVTNHRDVAIHSDSISVYCSVLDNVMLWKKSFKVL